MKNVILILTENISSFKVLIKYKVGEHFLKKPKTFLFYFKYLLKGTNEKFKNDSVFKSTGTFKNISVFENTSVSKNISALKNDSIYKNNSVLKSISGF